VLLRHLWRGGATLPRTLKNLELANIGALRGRVLDVGAGAHPTYWEYASLAPGARLLTLDRVFDNRPDVVADIEQGLPFAGDAFDVVLLLSVLEHTYDHRRVLREIARVLRPGGVFYLNVPFLVGVHTKAEAGFFVDDFFRYSRSGLVRLLAEEAHFRDIDVITHGGLFLSIINLLQPAVKWRPLWIACVLLASLLDRLADRRSTFHRERWVMGYFAAARKAEA
jgi:SAM-dependent methyltransferase